MKKLLIICLFAVLGMAVNAQQGYQEIDTDTVQGAETIYITATAKAAYSGFVTFDFTLDGFAADSCVVQLQGRNQSTKWIDVSSQSVGYNSTTATDYQLIANPDSYLYYRLAVTGVATDTVLVSDNLFIYKR